MKFMKQQKNLASKQISPIPLVSCENYQKLPEKQTIEKVCFS